MKLVWLLFPDSTLIVGHAMVVICSAPHRIGNAYSGISTMVPEFESFALRLQYTLQNYIHTTSKLDHGPYSGRF